MTNAKKLIEENLKTQNPRLDLGNCGLDGSEKELELLAACTHLETLIFSNVWQEYDWKKKGWAYFGSQNKGKENTLLKLPEHLPQQLKKLVMTGGEFRNKWKIQDLRPLQALTQLQFLHFSSNQVSDISPLQDLKNLKSLHFSSNQVSELSPVQDLKNLKSLHFSSNQVSELSPVQDLKNLKFLNFESNQVSDISPVQDLKNLVHLYFSSNQVSELSPLQDLTNLEVLRFELNQVSDISPVQDLTKLKYLYFRSNQVSELSPLQDLTNLVMVYFNSNPFLEKIPQEIQEKNWRKILQYWGDTYAKTITAAKPIREAKVVFVGEGGSGKTSLMNLLLYGTKNPTSRTERIEIHEDTTQFTYGEKQEKLTLRFWDFGGQDIMHATHKFFMSNRTLYVLISNGRKNEDAELENWVEMLQSSIGDSPVILLANHLDNSEDKHRIPDLELKRKFENIQLPVIETSWKSERGMQDLKNAIQTVLQKMPHFEEQFSPLYQSAKVQLLDIQKPYIDYREYENICQHAAQELESEFQELSQQILADFLNDLGIMLNFRKANDKLEDLFIFQPAWIVDGVYTIINAGEAQAQKGKIKEESISQLLKKINYKTAQERNFIINMMKHFQLAFEYHKGAQTYFLIPSLFDKNRPESLEKNWQKENLLRVRFEYTLWRNDYISYFLVQQHQQIEGEHYWINGAILNYGEQRVFIEAKRSQKSMMIEIEGAEDKRYAFWRVREALNQVHELFDVKKLGISMWVVYEEDGKRDEFEYEFLKNAQEDGVKEIYSSKLRKMLSVNKLLGEVALRKEEIPEVIQKAIQSLERDASLATYFDEMDKLDLPQDLRFDYAKLKRQFIDGDINFQISQRLITFAREVAKHLGVRL